MEVNAQQLDDSPYYADDLDCAYCLHRKRKTKTDNLPCREDNCRYEGIRLHALAHGRLIRTPEEVYKLPG